MDDAEKWDRIYSEQGSLDGSACRVLQEHTHLLPAGGRALDLACGRAANAMLLAGQGLHVAAWDISLVAIERLSKEAVVGGIAITAECRDVVASPPEKDSFDVIVVSRFLHRPLLPAIQQALRPQGLIFYQTFITDKVNAAGPNNPDYLLRENELLRVFRNFRILVYREEGRTGKLGEGFRNEAALVAQKVSAS